MIHKVQCGNAWCWKEIVVGNEPVPRALEDHIICSECQEKIAAERAVMESRLWIMEQVLRLEPDDLEWVVRLIKHLLAWEKDARLKGIGIPSVSHRARKKRHRQMVETEFEATWQQMRRDKEDDESRRENPD